jgi:predicted AAA+ superfamily ATPase
LFLAIKASVDRDTRPGRFLLTGSARVLALAALPDTLVGRMQAVELWPLSQGEMDGTGEAATPKLLMTDSSLCAYLLGMPAQRRSSDFRGLAHLRDRLGARFVAGFVLYLGAASRAFGDRLRALPTASL